MVLNAHGCRACGTWTAGEAHGNITAADIAERFVTVAESVLGVGDRLINAIGDAVLLASLDAVSGIGLVLRLFAACEMDAGLPELRAGLHSGPVVERAGDIFGATVNVAPG